MVFLWLSWTALQKQVAMCVIDGICLLLATTCCLLLVWFSGFNHRISELFREGNRAVSRRQSPLFMETTLFLRNGEGNHISRSLGLQIGPTFTVQMPYALQINGLSIPRSLQLVPLCQAARGPTRV